MEAKRKAATIRPAVAKKQVFLATSEAMPKAISLAPQYPIRLLIPPETHEYLPE
jgi:hypothetical protein